MKTRMILGTWGALLLYASVATGEEAFNGKNLDGWMVMPENPPVWLAKEDEDGEPMIARQPFGSYLWTEQKYTDFTLEMEYKVSPGCNSGVFFRSEPGNHIRNGFEIQILDSHGQEPNLRNTGALYDSSAPSAMPENPAGEWNTFRLECKGPIITVHINGVQVQDINIDRWDKPGRNPDGSENVRRKALKNIPRTGHIGFQDHGQNVWYRKIRITKL